MCWQQRSLGVTPGTSRRGIFSPSGVIFSNQSPFLTASGCESFTCSQEVHGQGTLIQLQNRVGSSCDSIWRYFCEPCKVQWLSGGWGQALMIRLGTLFESQHWFCSASIARRDQFISPLWLCKPQMQLFSKATLTKKHSFLYQSLGKSRARTHPTQQHYAIPSSRR